MFIDGASEDGGPGFDKVISVFCFLLFLAER